MMPLSNRSFKPPNGIIQFSSKASCMADRPNSVLCVADFGSSTFWLVIDIDGLCFVSVCCETLISMYLLSESVSKFLSYKSRLSNT